MFVDFYEACSRTNSKGKAVYIVSLRAPQTVPLLATTPQRGGKVRRLAFLHPSPFKFTASKAKFCLCLTAVSKECWRIASQTVSQDS